MERKLCEGPSSKHARSSDNVPEDDDDEAVSSHLTELVKEAKKAKLDESRVARLMSLTFANWRRDMLSLRANARITSTLEKYPCLEKPIFISL